MNTTGSGDSCVVWKRASTQQTNVGGCWFRFIWSSWRPCVANFHETTIFDSFMPQDNPGYNELFNFYLDNKYQLRYTGGMVPDVNQVNYWF